MRTHSLELVVLVLYSRVLFSHLLYVWLYTVRHVFLKNLLLYEVVHHKLNISPTPIFRKDPAPSILPTLLQTRQFWKGMKEMTDKQERKIPPFQHKLISINNIKYKFYKSQIHAKRHINLSKRTKRNI